MQERIDIVYTWVDGSDSIWRKKRQEALLKMSDIQETEQHGNVEWRFRDNGELRYSLRSLEKYFPNHGNIFIVTDSQVPDFLKQHKKITIIDHKDFMNPSSLPTFSSKNIISQIPKISAISEKFLVLNDDIFLGPDFQITDFFSHKPLFYFIPFEESQVQAQIVSWRSGEEILKEKYPDYISLNSYVTHTPKGVIKKDFFDMCAEFPEILKQVSYETFRSMKNPGIIGDLFSRWMIHTKRGTLGIKKDLYIQSSHANFWPLFDNFHNIPFFCINDTGDNIDKDDTSLRKISQVLEQLFPEKSCFEK